MDTLPATAPGRAVDSPKRDQKVQRLVSRAIRAHLLEDGAMQPAEGLSDAYLIPYGGRQLLHIVLRNVTGVLAVYRVRNSGALKKLKRWPAEVAA